MAVSIRQANLDDVDLIVSMWVEFMQNHDRILVNDSVRYRHHIKKRPDAAEVYREFLVDKIKSPDGQVNIAEVDGKPVGYSFIFIKDNVPVFRLKRLGYFSDMYVRKEYRGKRIASKLKVSAFRWFRKHGIRDISIAVYPANNRAIAIYERWGFQAFHIEMRTRLL